VLTKADGTLTDEAIKAIKDNNEIYQVIVVGGTSAVSDSVFGVLGNYSGNYKDYYNKAYIAVRIAGADRYDTSAKIADWEVNYAYDIKDNGQNNALKADYWKDAGFSFFETFVATGENFPDALAGGQLAGGKYYASESFKTNVARWNTANYVITNIKDASPILLTKDGNRAADSVIASNLAWNWGTRSVDAYDFWNDNLPGYLDDYLSLTEISPEVYANDAFGFFTDDVIGTAGATTDITNTIARISANWIDGYRTVDNNFHGVILGGKAAVSKDKAKQLDDTVKDSILTIQDPVATATYDTITINGKTYRTLSWLSSNKNWYSFLGVDGLTAETAIAVPYGAIGYRYLYQPVQSDLTAITYKTSDGTIATQTYQIEFAKFDSQSVNVFAPTNEYSGYGFVGYETLNVTFNYETGSAANNYITSATWTK
jgi:hypothetical protein